MAPLSRKIARMRLNEVLGPIVAWWFRPRPLHRRVALALIYGGFALLSTPWWVPWIIDVTKTVTDGSCSCTCPASFDLGGYIGLFALFLGSAIFIAFEYWRLPQAPGADTISFNSEDMLLSEALDKAVEDTSYQLRIIGIRPAILNKRLPKSAETPTELKKLVANLVRLASPGSEPFVYVDGPFITVEIRDDEQ